MEENASCATVLLHLAKRELLSSRDIRKLRTTCKAAAQALAPAVHTVSSPDKELLCSSGDKDELAFCCKLPGLRSIRVNCAQLGHLPGPVKRAVKQLTLVSDYTLSQQAFGRGQVLVDLRRILVLSSLESLRISDLLLRDGLEVLLHLRCLHTLDLSGALEINNKLMALLPRMPSLTSLSLPAPSCHAPRLNQCTSKGLRMVLPLMRRLKALHFKAVDLEPLGIEAVRSWQACPLTQPVIIRLLAEQTLPRLVSLTLEGLAEPPQSFSVAASSRTANTNSTTNSSGVDGEDRDTSGSSINADAGGADPDNSGTLVKQQGILYQALRELTGLKQLQYLCLGVHVALNFSDNTPSYDDVNGLSLPSPRRSIFPSQARTCTAIDDALVTVLCSELTQLTGLAFKECWSLGTPALDAIAQNLPGLKLLDLTGSCDAVAAIELTRLSALTQLHTLGLSRWGSDSWCTPYTFCQRLASLDSDAPVSVESTLNEARQVLINRQSHAQIKGEPCLPINSRPSSSRIGTAVDAGDLPQRRNMSSEHSWQDIDTEDFLSVRPSPFTALATDDTHSASEFLMPRLHSSNIKSEDWLLQQKHRSTASSTTRTSTVGDAAAATWPLIASQNTPGATAAPMFRVRVSDHGRRRSFVVPATSSLLSRSSHRSCGGASPVDPHVAASSSPLASAQRAQNVSEPPAVQHTTLRSESSAGARLFEGDCISPEAAALQRLVGRKARMQRPAAAAACSHAGSVDSVAVVDALGDALAALGTQHPHLTSLDLTGWSSIGSAALGRLLSSPAGNSLHQLRLAGCFGIHADEVQVLTKFVALKKLDLSYTWPQAAQLLALADCPVLDELILSQCNINFYASKAAQTLADTHAIRVSGCVDANAAIARMHFVLNKGDLLRNYRGSQSLSNIGHL